MISLLFMTEYRQFGSFIIIKMILIATHDSLATNPICLTASVAREGTPWAPTWRGHRGHRRSTGLLGSAHADRNLCGNNSSEFPVQTRNAGGSDRLLWIQLRKRCTPAPRRHLPVRRGVGESNRRIDPQQSRCSLHFWPRLVASRATDSIPCSMANRAS